MIEETKSQHFVFAYQAIPSLFHREPRSFLTYLRRDKMNFLRFWWDYVAKNVRQADPPTTVGLYFTIRELENGVTLTIITLPPPENPGEAYFIGLVLPKSSMALFFRRDFSRVFTLSCKPDTSNPSHMVIAEITPRLKYFEIEDGPEPGENEFNSAMLEIIKSQKI